MNYWSQPENTTTQEWAGAQGLPAQIYPEVAHAEVLEWFRKAIGTEIAEAAENG